MNNSDNNIEEATQAALECLLWTGTVYTGLNPDYATPMDSLYAIGDIADESVQMIRGYVYDMVDMASQYGIVIDAITPESFGHDFVLTAQHHGTGYWDRGYGHTGECLTEFAHKFSVDAYVGDDGMVHIS